MFFFSPECVAATNDRKLKLIEIDYHDCKNRSVRLPKKVFSALVYETVMGTRQQQVSFSGTRVVSWNWNPAKEISQS